MNWSIYFFIAVFLIILDMAKKNKLVYMMLYFQFLLIGFRYRLGWDFDTYTREYINNSGIIKDEYFLILMSILKDNNFHSQMLFFIVNFIKITTIFIMANKLLKYRSLAIYLYFTTNFFFTRDLSNLRQNISEACFLWLIYFVYYKRKKIGYIFNLGYKFHPSILIANTFLLKTDFFLKNNRNKYIMIFFSLSGGIIFSKILQNLAQLINCSDNLIYKRYLSYIKGTGSQILFSGFYSLSFSLIFISTIIIISNKNDKVEIINRVENIYFNSFLFLIGVASFEYPVARLAYYGLILYIFIFPFHLERLKKNKFTSIKKNILIILLMLHGTLFFGEYILKGNEKVSSKENKSLRFKIQILN